MEPRSDNPAAITRHAETIEAYLRAPALIGPLGVLFLFSAIYHAGSKLVYADSFVLLAVAALLFLLRAPRWACYLILTAALALYLWGLIFTVSVDSRDFFSDRDDQLEIATRGYLVGENPWAHRPDVDIVISMGPSSVLLATPFMAVFDRINELTLAFYVLLFAFLLAADLSRRNDTFVLIVLLFLGTPGMVGFRHTLMMSLEELHFAYLALALGWMLVVRGRPMGTGACFAYALLSRPSYAFPVAAFLGWYFYSPHYRLAGLGRMVVGGALASGVILLPIALVAGADLFQHNPWFYAGEMLAEGWPDTNLVFRAANLVSQWAGPTGAGVLKTLAALGIIALASVRLARRKLEHPFWHLALAGFLASMMVYYPDLLYDYLPYCGFPALMAIAYSRGDT